MRVPKSFKLMGSRWTVEEVSDLVALGECHRDILTIKIRKGLKPAIKETTFYHELFHAMLFSVGLTDHNEEKVDLMGALMHQFLKTMN